MSCPMHCADCIRPIRAFQARGVCVGLFSLMLASTKLISFHDISRGTKYYGVLYIFAPESKQFRRLCVFVDCIELAIK